MSLYLKVVCIERFQRPVGRESRMCCVLDLFILTGNIDSATADLYTGRYQKHKLGDEYESTQGAQVNWWYASRQGVQELLACWWYEWYQSLVATSIAMGSVPVDMLQSMCHGGYAVAVSCLFFYSLGKPTLVASYMQIIKPT